MHNQQKISRRFFLKQQFLIAIVLLFFTQIALGYLNLNIVFELSISLLLLLLFFCYTIPSFAEIASGNLLYFKTNTIAPHKLLQIWWCRVLFASKWEYWDKIAIRDIIYIDIEMMKSYQNKTQFSYMRIQTHESNMLIPLTFFGEKAVLQNCVQKMITENPNIIIHDVQNII